MFRQWDKKERKEKDKIIWVTSIQNEEEKYNGWLNLFGGRGREFKWKKKMKIDFFFLENYVLFLNLLLSFIFTIWSICSSILYVQNPKISCSWANKDYISLTISFEWASNHIIFSPQICTKMKMMTLQELIWSWESKKKSLFNKYVGSLKLNKG